MIITIEKNLRLELVAEKHAQPIFDLAYANKQHLREWLPWVDNMHSVNFIQNFVKGSLQRHEEGAECAFVIVYDDNVVGRIGVYKMDNPNRTGEIGYWVGVNTEGKGVVTKSCIALVDFCFENLNLNRIEIKCGTENKKSQTIPERLHFSKEGILRQAEYLHGKFIDLYLYARCKNDT